MLYAPYLYRWEASNTITATSTVSKAVSDIANTKS